MLKNYKNYKFWKLLIIITKLIYKNSERSIFFKKKIFLLKHFSKNFTEI